MTLTRTAILVLVCSLVSAVTGGLSGYYAALTTPVATPIAVVDIEAMASGIDSKSPDALKRMQEVSDQAKLLTQKLTESGVIVLDRANVIGAPEQAVIRVEPPRK